MDTRPAVVFRNVSFTLEEDLQVFSNLDLEVSAAERVVICGNSGVGNSFFGRIALGLFRPSQGRVEVLGFDTLHATVEELHSFRQHTGFVFRDARLISNLGVERNIALPLNYHRIFRPEVVHRRVEDLLDLMGLDELRDLRPVSLTAETRMLTALARAAVMAPEVIFFDDPLAGFSDDVSRRLVDAIDRIGGWIARNGEAGQPPAMLIAVTDPDPFEGFADRTGIFQDGRVRFEVSPESSTA